jgi:hypothetical protein
MDRTVGLVVIGMIILVLFGGSIFSNQGGNNTTTTTTTSTSTTTTTTVTTNNVGETSGNIAVNGIYTDKDGIVHNAPTTGIQQDIYNQLDTSTPVMDAGISPIVSYSIGSGITFAELHYNILLSGYIGTPAVGMPLIFVKEDCIQEQWMKSYTKVLSLTETSVNLGNYLICVIVGGYSNLEAFFVSLWAGSGVDLTNSRHSITVGIYDVHMEYRVVNDPTTYTYTATIDYKSVGMTFLKDPVIIGPTKPTTTTGPYVPYSMFGLFIQPEIIGFDVSILLIILVMFILSIAIVYYVIKIRGYKR